MQARVEELLARYRALDDVCEWLRVSVNHRSLSGKTIGEREAKDVLARALETALTDIKGEFDWSAFSCLTRAVETICNDKRNHVARTLAREQQKVRPLHVPMEQRREP